MELDIEEKASILLLIGTAASTFFLDYPMYMPMRRADYLLSELLAFFVGILIVVGILGLITYYMWTTYRSLTREGKFVFRDLTLTFTIGTVAIALLLVRLVDLILYGSTDIIVFGRYIDPIAFAIFMASITYVAYFYFLWALKYTGAYKQSISIPALGLYIICGILVILPDNNYSNVIEYVTPIKVASRAVFLVALAIPAIIVIRHGLQRIKITSGVRKIRLLMLIISNVLIVISLFFWLADALVEQTYSPYIGASFVLLMLAFFGVSLSILWPEWFASLAERLFEEK